MVNSSMNNQMPSRPSNVLLQDKLKHETAKGWHCIVAALPAPQAILGVALSCTCSVCMEAALVEHCTSKVSRKAYLKQGIW